MRGQRIPTSSAAATCGREGAGWRYEGHWDQSFVFRVPAEQIRAARGTVECRVVAWLGCYESMSRLSGIAAVLRLRSTSRVSALIAECDRDLGTGSSGARQRRSSRVEADGPYETEATSGKADRVRLVSFCRGTGLKTPRNGNSPANPATQRGVNWNRNLGDRRTTKL